jgi:hypothetical protein
VKSVRLTFDRPKRSYCEGRAPYSVFGDNNGNFLDATIPLGSHLVTATPYARTGCKGRAGVPLSKNFTVNGCTIFYRIYSVNTERYGQFLGFTGSYFEDIFGYEDLVDPVVSARPCKVNILVEPICGFNNFGLANLPLKMELRNAVTNKVVVASEDPEYPFYLFGNVGYGGSRDPVTLFGSIQPGKYTINSTIEGIQHPSLSFTVGNRTCI